MKKIISVLLISSTLFLTACSSNNSSVTTESKDKTSKTEPVKKDKPKKKEKAAIGKRSNPVKLGEKATFDTSYYPEDGDNSIEANASLSFDNITRGEEAYKQLLEANEFNAAAPEGKEWVILDATFKLNKGNKDEAMFVSPSLTPISANGEEISQNEYPTFKDGEEFNYKKVFEGGEINGKVGMLVNKGEDFLIEYNDYSAKLYFDTKI